MAPRLCSACRSSKMRAPISGCASCHPTPRSRLRRKPRMNKLKIRDVKDLMEAFARPQGLFGGDHRRVCQSDRPHRAPQGRDGLRVLEAPQAVLGRLRGIDRAVDAKAGEEALTAFEASGWGSSIPQSARADVLSLGSLEQGNALLRLPRAGLQVHLHHQCHRDCKRPASAGRQSQGSLPQRRCGDQAARFDHKLFT